jgi:DNA gyrase inhibitor GyrI
LAARQARNTQEFDVSVEQIETQHCIAVEHIGSIMLIEQAMTTLFIQAQEQQVLAAQPDMIAVFLDDPTNADVRDMRSLACLVQDVERPVGSPLMSYAVERATYVRLA